LVTVKFKIMIAANIIQYVEFVNHPS
jgi:hypothetical protein